MKPIKIKEVVKAVDGELINNFENEELFITNVSTDTRTITSGELFVALRGDNFDGHKFIDTALSNGAACVISEESYECDKPVIKVKNTLESLGKLASYYLDLMNIPVVAVTGSVGKTTTKDLIASVLSQKYNVLKTEGNFNNEIGVPLTIFNIEKETEVCVLEMGMNNFGEIHRLSKITKPDIAVITNIGYSHIENLGSRQGILKAKCEIFDFMKKGGIKILNKDDDMIADNIKRDINTMFYGIEGSRDFFAEDIDDNSIEKISCKIHMPNESFDVTIPLPGMHIVSNALAATAVGVALELSSEQIKAGIESFAPTKMRMDIINTNKYTIINDVYNSSPSAVKASIDVIGAAKTRKVCILGDMLELGEHSENLHKEIGEYAIQNNIDVLICIGKQAFNIYKGAVIYAVENEVPFKSKNPKSDFIFTYRNENSETTLELKEVYGFDTQEQFWVEMNEILKPKDAILIKASRGMKFEKTTEILNN